MLSSFTLILALRLSSLSSNTLAARLPVSPGFIPSISDSSWSTLTPPSPHPHALSSLSDSRSIPFKLASAPGDLIQQRIYVVSVSVAGFSYEVILDTGSSDLWIDTGKPENQTPAPGQTVDTRVPVLLEYGVDGAETYARGTVQYADVYLTAGKSGSDATSITVHNQSFANVPGTTNISQYGNHGILGLGPPGGWCDVRDVLSDTPEWNGDPLVLRLFEQNPDLPRYHTVLFSPRDATGIVHEGIVTLGEVVPSLAAILDARKWPLMRSDFWTVPSRGFLVDGKLINPTAGLEELPFVLDSGAYTVLLPPEYVAAMYSTVAGSYLLDDGSWSVPCNTNMNVSMVFGEDTFFIHPIDLTEVYDLEDGKPLCRGLIQSNTDERISYLIGLNALRNLYVLHNYGHKNKEEPYVQIISTTNWTQASTEFDSINAARLKAFMASNTKTTGSSGDAAGSSDLSTTTTLPLIRTLSMPNDDLKLLMQTILVLAACVVVVYHVLRRRCCRRRPSVIHFF